MTDAIRPFTFEQLKAVQKVIIHGSCPDGMAAAILIQNAYVNAFPGAAPVSIVFAKHGTPEYLNVKVEPGLLFCDIVPPTDRIEEFVAAGTLVLDHHVKVAHEVKRFGANGIYDNESGALLAFRYIWSKLLPSVDKTKAERFAVLADIRDTWKETSPDWEEACAQAAGLMFFQDQDWLRLAPSLFRNIEIVNHAMQERMDIGRIVHGNKKASLKRSYEGAYKVRTGRGCRVMIVNGGSVSDLAGMVRDEVDVVLSFNYAVENGRACMRVSARSQKSFDVGDLATKNGGGGHRTAAGFVIYLDDVPSADPYTVLRKKLDEAGL